MRQMQKLSARRSAARICASCRSRALSSRPCCRYTMRGRDSSRRARPKRTRSEACSGSWFDHPKGIWHIAQRVPGLLEDASNELPLTLRQLIDRLPHHLKELDRPVRELEREILVWHRNSDLSRKLEQIPG